MHVNGHPEVKEELHRFFPVVTNTKLASHLLEHTMSVNHTLIELHVHVADEDLIFRFYIDTCQMSMSAAQHCVYHSHLLGVAPLIQRV